MVCEGDRSILKAKGDDMQCNINKPPRFSKDYLGMLMRADFYLRKRS